MDPAIPLPGTLDYVVGVLTTMAGTVRDGALSAVSGVLPQVAAVIAAVIVATLGVKLVRRFAR